MPLVKLETTDPTFLPLDTGDRLFGWLIRHSLPGSPHFLVEVPTSDLARLDALVAAGTLRDWRFAHTYRPALEAWLPHAGETPGDTFPLLGATDAVRARGRYGAGVLVGLVDTGCDANHVAFAGKTVEGARTDSHGHGTHVAATAASAWGLASDAPLFVQAALAGGQGSEAAVANGIRAVADAAQRRRVPCALNLSLGGPPSQAIDAAVAYAQARGCVVCAAAGNDPQAAIGSPARQADLIVLAGTRDGALAEFTSGRSWPQPNRVISFGVQIASARAGTPDGVLVASGTSMATPHVTGAAALLLAAGVPPRAVAGRVGEALA